VQVKLDVAGVPTYTIAENVAWDRIRSDGENLLPRDTAVICFGTLALRRTRTRNTIFRAVQTRSIPATLRILDVNFRRPFLPPVSILEECFASADWIKLSEDDVRVREELLQTALLVKPGVLIHTRGGDGCDVITADGRHHEPAAPANVLDTVGAGDAFTAAMVCLHLEGCSLQTCARFASYYAARVCEYPGATPRIDRRDVERAAFGK
jgi:fructokinase